ncbi:MAG TPA: hypothetical protein VG325_20660 [Solirubrobacteraceae bacterium]|nr:hypothetical protein [Solirubrobacteraceae bacterium]
MSRLTADSTTGAAAVVIAETAAPPPTLNPAAQRVLAEIALWCPAFAGGELRPADGGPPSPAPGERFAGLRMGVRAAGLGHPSASGTLHVTDRRAIVLSERSEPLREWAFGDLTDVSALGNWGGLALVHPSGDTELVVTAGPEPPTWQDATGWLKVEAAFSAAGGRLELWMAELPLRLAVAGDA